MTGSIVLETCRAHYVTPEEFFDGAIRRRDVLACRIEAIARLRAAGFSNAAVARAMRRHYDTIRYWAVHDFRKRKIARMHDYIDRRAQS